MMDNSRLNNFDFLRLLFASLVIVSHSYLIVGRSSDEFLKVLTNNQEAFGGLAVKCFFIISGFLIFQSLERSKSLLNYLWKRIIRIYPGYFVMLIVTLFLIPFVYQGSESLWQNKSYYAYFFNQMSLYFLQDNIDGVFEKQPSSIINGSLWTIAYEFSMYIIVGLMFFIKKKQRVFILIFLFIISYILIVTNNSFFLNNRFFSKIHLQSPAFYDLLCFFMAGALLSKVNLKSNSKKYFLIIFSFFLIIISFMFNYWSFSKYLLLPVLIISIGQLSTPYLNTIGIKFGDISYGVYIYGWFIQQLLQYWFGLSTYPLMIFSLIVAFVAGLLSWHLVEKKALSYKNLIS